jgi:predicted nucleic acid-binding protein
MSDVIFVDSNILIYAHDAGGTETRESRSSIRW